MCFEHFKDLDLGLLGKYIDMFKVEDEGSAMVEKCPLSTAKVNTYSCMNFPYLEIFLESSDENLTNQIHESITEHLQNLATTFGEYFTKPDPNEDWIIHLFYFPEIKKMLITEIGLICNKTSEEKYQGTSHFRNDESGTQRNLC